MTYVYWFLTLVAVLQVDRWLGAILQYFISRRYYRRIRAAVKDFELTLDELGGETFDTQAPTTYN